MRGAELAVGLVDHDQAGGGRADGGEHLGAGRLAGRVVGRAPEGQVGGGLGDQVGGGRRVEQLVAGWTLVTSRVPLALASSECMA